MSGKIDELHGLLNENVAKVGELLKKEEAVEKKKNKTVWIFAAIGVVLVAAAAIYGLYRFFAPDYLEDFEDDFDDDFDDDFFEDDEKEDGKKEDEADKKEDAKSESEDDVTDDMTEDED